ncbi:MULTISPECIES: molecular chaperone HtpG [unclassified Fusibacter]|uniref:molecular chaperone HtpG n=1 Tax=unclassified Fusibacter TaxID=2624464 RepID=UPI0010112A76|nr:MULTISPECIES: molecular chaperone HtpG [unclassified Fusibacter]MCK8061208.1 molecular chaperone HtpG [Fusibacter sp. A2]NPE23448.1 molecular chaperone HtpG [Fusibacter sp. A1]RXV59227.1 molecular chaperone HtpG [Fusibacter sp. A1]
MSQVKGNLSIHSENIFPIIKKWLYSDHDIFMRELVSNASDAITKVKRLASLGEADLKGDDDFKITVTYNDKEKTIVINDNGIGMTADEIQKYINQIAFSGAEEFVEKFKDKADQDQIIGHFGLGFYSSFMVAHTVTIDTLSYVDGSEPAFWTCDGGIEFSISEGTRTTRGTTITLHLGEDGNDFKNEYKVKSTLEKYCGFMPYPIFFEAEGQEAPQAPAGENDEASSDEPVVIEPINETTPLYVRQPSSVTDEEYKEFYRKTFMDFKEPLFWIHLNMDYPFNLKGILYFPKINSEFEGMEGQIKLYNSQVYVADNIKEVIPEFLLLLKGVIDCPDLPLNVSRSFLQNDGFVKKISDYITKKVGDKLNGLYKTDRENYEKFWTDINPFVKFGALKDDKFYDRVKDSILYNSTEQKFVTLPEYREAMKEHFENDVYYVTDPVQQAQYVKMLQEHGIEALEMPERIDQAFINFIESKTEGVSFKRVDDDLSELLTENEEHVDEDAQKSMIETLSGLFKKVLNKENVKIELKALKTKDVASMITLSEGSRRMQDMMKMYNMGGMGMNLPNEETLVLNKNHKLVKYTLEHMYDSNDTAELVAHQLYDLAVLSHKPLSPDQMSEFIKRSNEIMEKLI